MSCRRIKGLLSRYVDKELTDTKDISLVEEHISICPHCRGELDSPMALKKLFAQKHRLGADVSFLARLKARLHEESESEYEVAALDWLNEVGDLAKRLIPVPVAIMIIIAVFLIGQIKEESVVKSDVLFGLTGEEMLDIYF